MPPSLLRPPPPLQREVTAKGHFLLPYTPPHLHMHTCIWLALTSMFTLVLRCYYVVIFAKCVRLRKAAYVWYRTMTAILLRRERGRNNAEMYAVLVVTPPPLFSAKLRFKRGGVTTREYGTCPSCGPSAPAQHAVMSGSLTATCRPGTITPPAPSLLPASMQSLLACSLC